MLRFSLWSTLSFTRCPNSYVPILTWLYFSSALVNELSVGVHGWGRLFGSTFPYLEVDVANWFPPYLEICCMRFFSTRLWRTFCYNKMIISHFYYNTTHVQRSFDIVLYTIHWTTLWLVFSPVEEMKRIRGFIWKPKLSFVAMAEQFLVFSLRKFHNSLLPNRKCSCSSSKNS